MLTLRLQTHSLPASAIANVAGVPETRRALWCGRGEGWLLPSEFIRRTEADIARYAAAQPLRFRAAIAGCALRFPRRTSAHRSNTCSTRCAAELAR